MRYSRASLVITWMADCLRETDVNSNCVHVHKMLLLNVKQSRTKMKLMKKFESEVDDARQSDSAMPE